MIRVNLGAGVLPLEPDCQSAWHQNTEDKKYTPAIAAATAGLRASELHQSQVPCALLQTHVYGEVLIRPLPTSP